VRVLAAGARALLDGEICCGNYYFDMLWRLQYNSGSVNLGWAHVLVGCEDDCQHGVECSGYMGSCSNVVS
jgi:hypothetical protein